MLESSTGNRVASGSDRFGAGALSILARQKLAAKRLSAAITALRYGIQL